MDQIDRSEQNPAGVASQLLRSDIEKPVPFVTRRPASRTSGGDDAAQGVIIQNASRIGRPQA